MTKRKLENEIILPAKISRIDEVINRGNSYLMMLNELGIKGLAWNIKQECMFPQKFHCSCQFTEPYAGNNDLISTGTTFYSEGSNKSSCKHDIAEQIIKRLQGTSSNGVLVNTPIEKVSTANELPKADDSVRILNEKVKDLDYKFIITNNGFVCSVNFRDMDFEGGGASKKIAKRIVACQILKKFFKIVFAEDKVQQPSDQSMDHDSSGTQLPTGRQKLFSNQIQAMIKNGFEKIISNVDVQYAKRKVVAGIVLSRNLRTVYPEYCFENQSILSIDPIEFFANTGWSVNQNDPGEILKVIVISSGTKCISGNDLNLDGYSVNDCHAEVIAKRALQLFLYKAINLLQSAHRYDINEELYGCDIVERINADNPWVYKLKDDVNFHLYISSAPCGDGRIFMPQNPGGILIDEPNEEADDSHPNRKNRGLLRTKIECGEGTIPIKSKNILTWDGVIVGERLRTMSCSDKLCSWLVLGAQGALLSNMLQYPIYFDSIVIGSLFHHDHLCRALIERAKPLLNHLEWMNIGSGDAKLSDEEQGELRMDIPDRSCNYSVKYPILMTVSEPDDRCAGKSSSYSVNWILGMNSFEVISTSKGLTVDNSPSRLCKRSLFQEFLKSFLWLPYLSAPNGCYSYIEMKSLTAYPDFAIGSLIYQKRRIALFNFLENQGFGHWMGKPSELDSFSIKFTP